MKCACSLAQSTGFALVVLLSAVLGPGAPAQERTSPAAEATTAGFVPDGERCVVASIPATDGRSTVTVRGASCDGRPFIKTVLAGLTGNSALAPDTDLDLKVAILTGFSDAEMHDVELRVWRHAGVVRDFTLTARLGPGAQLTGRQRVRSDDHRIMVFETNDAGTLLRFFDFYPRVREGKIRLSFDVFGPDAGPREGRLAMYDFLIVGEPALRPLLEPARDTNGDDQVAFSRLNLSFKPLPDKLAIGEGVAYGPLLAATVAGLIDFASNNLSLTGALVPVYATKSPILPDFSRYPEGLFALTYEITGSPRAPIMRINPFGPAHPGFLRKLLEFPRDDDDDRR
jgi:hypothetical protein